jgi:protein phosphatase
MFDAIEYTNSVLYQHNLTQHRPEGGMGTTLTGFCRPLLGGELVFFHVGDSRLYCQHNGQLRQMTQDQTLYQQAVNAGIRENLPPRNMLLQAIGPCAHIKPVIRTFTPKPHDVLLLCSDGLYGAVPHQLIEKTLANTNEATLEHACHHLINLAKQGGGRDNITALMVSCP